MNVVNFVIWCCWFVSTSAAAYTESILLFASLPDSWVVDTVLAHRPKMPPAVQCWISQYKILPVKPFTVLAVQLTVLFLNHLWLLLLLFIKIFIICTFKLTLWYLALLNIDICDSNLHNIIYHWFVLWIVIYLSCPLTLRIVFLPIYCCQLRSGVYFWILTSLNINICTITKVAYENIITNLICGLVALVLSELAQAIMLLM